VTRAEIIAQENNGFSLLDSKGNTTERFEEASRIGLALQKHPDLFAQPTKPKANIGILINEENYQFCNTFYGTDRHLSYSIRGWYHLFWRNGFAIDFVNINEIDHDTPNQYKVLILPFPLSLSDTLAFQLKTYISQGGNLTCEAAAGRIDENGFAVRGEMSPLIAELAGVEQKRFVGVYEPNGEQRWTPNERTWGEYDPVTWLEGMGSFAGTRLLSNYFLQTFDLKGGSAIFKADSEVAGVVNGVGEGKIWLFGTFLGHGGTAYYTESNLDFVQELMDECGVSNQKINELLVQKRMTQDKEAWIITNPTDQDLYESLDLGGMENPEMLIGDVVERKENLLKFRINSLDVAVLVFEK
jgi:beta-galactosidase GanA